VGYLDLDASARTTPYASIMHDALRVPRALCSQCHAQRVPSREDSRPTRSGLTISSWYQNRQEQKLQLGSEPTTPMSKRDAIRRSWRRGQATGFAEILRGSCAPARGVYTARYPKMPPVSLLETVWQQWLINSGYNKTSMSQAPLLP
jgi:hypothetical protein